MTRRGPRRPYPHALRALVALLLALGGLLASRSPATADQAAERHVVVKYAHDVDACVHCLLAHGVPLARFTGSGTLDALHARLGVQRAAAVFLDHHTLAGGRSAAWTMRSSAVAARAPQRAARSAAARAAAKGGDDDLSGVYELELPPGSDLAAAVAALAADPSVVYAEPVYERHASYLPDDPYLASQGTWGQPYADLWGIGDTQASALWDVTRGEGAVVAVVDTGVHVKHKDLAANVWRNPGEIARNRIDDDGNGYVDDVQGWDFLRKTWRMADRHGHGTHVAGTVAAVGDNGLGVVGMAWGARIMPLRGLDERGQGRTTDLARAMMYAVENGADVINNSWGGYGPPAAVIADAVAAARAAGVVVVFAAGNEGATDFALGEANLPDAIAVAAITPSGVRAGFSNYGDAISVAAPGVDVLSTRATAGRVGGTKVTSRYLRLSGTSMAAPHVAGLAALVLSARPDLSIDEVRWRLELSAYQPGYPGFTGDAWNPYLGWGLIRADGILATPPVTTRVKLGAAARHAFAGTTTPDLATLALRFTTEDVAVAWDFAGSDGFVGAQAGGAGDATFAVGIDATGLAPGTVSGTVGVTAPDASDGGGSRPLSVQLHADPRVGPPIRLQDNVVNGSDAPAVASNGTATLAVWGEHTQGLKAARLDADGTVTSPITLLPPACPSGCWAWPSNAIAAASDGDGFLIVFRSYLDEWSFGQARETRREYVHALRVAADGTPLGAPLEVASQVQTTSHDRPSYDAWFGFPRVTFDGNAYQVLWNVNRENGGNTDTSTTFLRRVPVTGAVSDAAVQVYPRPGTTLHQIVYPDVACVAAGDCLVAWIESTGGTVPGGTLWARNMVGVRVAGGTPASTTPPVLLANADYNAFVATRVAAHPGGYAVLALRNSCPTSGSSICGWDLVAGRVSAGGVPVDTAGFRVNVHGPDGDPYCRPLGMTFDGTDFVAAYLDLRSVAADPQAPRPLFPGLPIFAARFSPAGVVLDQEEVGRLVYPGATALAGEVVRSDAGTLVVWEDNRHTSVQHAFSIWAQRVGL